MRRIKKRLFAFILVIVICSITVVTPYTHIVYAAEIGVAATSESLQWIFTILASMGMSVSVKELLKPRQADIEKDIGKSIDWDNYDWGDLLDSPAAQDQIKDIEDQFEKLYYGHTEAYKKTHGGSDPDPTPTDSPSVSPPVTVAPINPDDVEMPFDWDSLKRTSLNNGFLTLGAATYWCLKETVGDWWDSLINNTVPDVDLQGNPLTNRDLVGYVEFYVYLKGKLYRSDFCYVYKPSFDFYFEIKNYTGGELYYQYVTFVNSTYSSNNSFKLPVYKITHENGRVFDEVCSVNGLSPFSTYAYTTKIVSNFNLYAPYVLDGVKYDASVKPNDKNTLWVNPDLKSDYDNNKSPSLSDTIPAPAIKIPSIDDIKDLQDKANDADDEKRPSIIQEFITNHYTNPTPAPEPTTAPDPEPEPTTVPDPEPSETPDPTTTPAVNPEISGAPKPSGTPENPDDTDSDTDVDVDKYKTDLRLIFPFCIPFDLIHLLQAFEADPEAPAFEFPVDFELENPFTGRKVLDYHHTFTLDMSDYEPVIKIFRIFEIIFFVIGLLMITRQQMIKG